MSAAPNLSIVSSQPPHLLLDLEGRVVSCVGVEALAQAKPVELVNANGQAVGSVICLPQDLEAIRSRFSGAEPGFSSVRRERSRQVEEILEADLEAILHSAAMEGRNIEQLLYRCCLYLRAYICAENCSVYGLPDGSTLQGMMAVSPGSRRGKDGEWNYASMHIAGLVIQGKRPYVCADTSQDPNFQPAADGGFATRNLICFPILSAGEPIGIINLSNKAGGSFGDEDLRAVQKFSTVISHLLREEFARNRSEKFQATSANLSKYLSTNLVKKIATTGTSGGLGGSMKNVVVLFSDIRSFTKISEGLPAPTLVELLNFYFEEMSAVIEKHGGTLDKLVGDMMMVLWNVPNEQPEPEVLALKAALEMQKVAFRKVAPRWKDAGVSEFGIGIGINAGQAVAGNMGSRHFMNYTVIGSTINMAQRLESKARSGEIWVEEGLLPRLEGKVPQPVRREVKLQLKGFTESVGALVYKAAT